MKRFKLITAMIALLPLLVSPAIGKGSRYQKPAQIRIESRYDSNTYIIAPLRPSHGGGYEVRLPGGTWIHCEHNCHWAVQKQYLDFFRYQQQPFGPGYLRFRF